MAIQPTPASKIAVGYYRIYSKLNPAFGLGIIDQTQAAPALFLVNMAGADPAKTRFHLTLSSSPADGSFHISMDGYPSYYLTWPDAPGANQPWLCYTSQSNYPYLLQSANSRYNFNVGTCDPWVEIAGAPGDGGFSGSVFDIPRGIVVNGAQIYYFTENGGDNQQWMFEQVS
jgi:hypothetical protein